MSSRRKTLAVFAAGAAAGAMPWPLRAVAARPELVPTVAQTAGPFYPVDWNGDVDNDLVMVHGEAARALGQVAHLRGRVLDRSGNSLAGSMLEIWQCDANGRYLHPADRGGARRDAGFQGRGRTRADDHGRYAFRTIRPAPYSGRTPHIHFAIWGPDGSQLVTQLYVAGEPRNERDRLYNSIRDPRRRASVTVRFEPADRIEPGALVAEFDIVLG